jgi:arylsulfatase A
LQARPEAVARFEAKRAALDSAQPDFTAGVDGRVRARQSHPTYAAMMESLDRSVGQVLAHLEILGVARDTIVVFTSDNGGLSTAEGSPTSNLPLRAGKGWAYEGGVRVPLLVSWPGRIAPRRVADAVVTSPDFFPTLLELAGLPARPADHADGASFAPVLLDPAARPAERAVCWHYPHYSNQRGKPHGAVRAGRWKLVEWFEDGAVELFDLAADLSEAEEVSRAQPGVARDLLAKLRAWRAEVGAQMPTPNPAYQPNPPAKPAARADS